MRDISMQDKNGKFVVLDSDLVIQELINVNPEVRGIPFTTVLNVGLQVIESHKAKEKEGAEGSFDEVTQELSGEVLTD